MKDIVRQLTYGPVCHRPIDGAKIGFGKAAFRRSPQALTRLRDVAVLILILLPSLSSRFLRAEQQDSASEPVVIAYLFPRNSVIQANQIAAGKLSRINFAFANIQGGKMVEGDATDAANYAALNSLKLDHPSLKILASVGGWLWSVNFSDVALTAESRKIFIQSVVEFVEKLKLDGLDVD